MLTQILALTSAHHQPALQESDELSSQCKQTAKLKKSTTFVCEFCKLEMEKKNKARHLGRCKQNPANRKIEQQSQVKQEQLIELVDETQVDKDVQFENEEKTKSHLLSQEPIRKRDLKMISKTSEQLKESTSDKDNDKDVEVKRPIIDESKLRWYQRPYSQRLEYWLKENKLVVENLRTLWQEGREFVACLRMETLKATGYQSEEYQALSKILQAYCYPKEDVMEELAQLREHITQRVNQSREHVWSSATVEKYMAPFLYLCTTKGVFTLHIENYCRKNLPEQYEIYKKHRLCKGEDDIHMLDYSFARRHNIEIDNKRMKVYSFTSSLKTLHMPTELANWYNGLNLEEKNEIMHLNDVPLMWKDSLLEVESSSKERETERSNIREWLCHILAFIRHYDKEVKDIATAIMLFLKESSKRLEGLLVYNLFGDQFGYIALTKCFQGKLQLYIHLQLEETSNGSVIVVKRGLTINGLYYNQIKRKYFEHAVPFQDQHFKPAQKKEIKKLINQVDEDNKQDRPYDDEQLNIINDDPTFKSKLATNIVDQCEQLLASASTAVGWTPGGEEKTIEDIFVSDFTLIDQDQVAQPAVQSMKETKFIVIPAIEEDIPFEKDFVYLASTLEMQGMRLKVNNQLSLCSFDKPFTLEWLHKRISVDSNAKDLLAIAFDQHQLFLHSGKNGKQSYSDLALLKQCADDLFEFSFESYRKNSYTYLNRFFEEVLNYQCFGIASRLIDEIKVSKAVPLSYEQLIGTAKLQTLIRKHSSFFDCSLENYCKREFKWTPKNTSTLNQCRLVRSSAINLSKYLNNGMHVLAIISSIISTFKETEQRFLQTKRVGKPTYLTAIELVHNRILKLQTDYTEAQNKVDRIQYLQEVKNFVELAFNEKTKITKGLAKHLIAKNRQHLTEDLIKKKSQLDDPKIGRILRLVSKMLNINTDFRMNNVTIMSYEVFDKYTKEQTQVNDWFINYWDRSSHQISSIDLPPVPLFNEKKIVVNEKPLAMKINEVSLQFDNYFLIRFNEEGKYVATFQTIEFESYKQRTRVLLYRLREDLHWRANEIMSQKKRKQTEPLVTESDVEEATKALYLKMSQKMLESLDEQIRIKNTQELFPSLKDLKTKLIYQVFYDLVKFYKLLPQLDTENISHYAILLHNEYQQERNIFGLYLLLLDELEVLFQVALWIHFKGDKGNNDEELELKFNQWKAKLYCSHILSTLNWAQTKQVAVQIANALSLIQKDQENEGESCGGMVYIRELWSIEDLKQLRKHVEKLDNKIERNDFVNLSLVLKSV